MDKLYWVLDEIPFTNQWYEVACYPKHESAYTRAHRLRNGKSPVPSEGIWEFFSQKETRKGELVGVVYARRTRKVRGKKAAK